MGRPVFSAGKALLGASKQMAASDDMAKSSHYRSLSQLSYLFAITGLQTGKKPEVPVLSGSLVHAVHTAPELTATAQCFLYQFL